MSNTNPSVLRRNKPNLSAQIKSNLCAGFDKLPSTKSS